MRKTIGTVLLAACTAFIVGGAVAIWNGCRIAEEGFTLAWLLAGTLGTLLGLLGGFFTLKPRIEFGPIAMSFETLPLELLFQVRNAGLFSLTNVRCTMADFRMQADATRPVVLYTHDPEGRLDRAQQCESFPSIAPGHADTLDIRKMIPLMQQQPDSAHVLIDISGQQLLWLTRLREKYKYKLFRSADGKYHWSEVSAT